MTAGCTGTLRGGILHLTIDTRGSSVNVFSPAVALELERELQAGIAAGATAGVVRSAKPGSFVNGVGLLLAAASHAPGAALERARTVQRCYESLASAPVPTIAAIEGNCYGCGLELALTCDYRVARDSYDTHFYMPELRDYAFIPLFGATQRLPRLLGLREAMRLLTGERVGAAEAARIGLADELLPEAVFEARLRSFLSRLRARGWPKRAAAPLRRSSPRPLDALPGPERPLAEECLRLSRLPFAAGYRLEDGLRQELASFGQSVATGESTRAMSFFFVRQAAKAHAIGSASYQRPRRVALAFAGRTSALRSPERILRDRRLPGIEVKPRGSIVFSHSQRRGAFACTVRGRGRQRECLAYLPFPREEVPVIELVPASAARPWRPGADLFQVLEQAGFSPVVTRARDRFVSERLVDAFHAEGGPAAHAALLAFGYRLPRALRRGDGPASDPDAADRVSLALVRVCLAALDAGELTHPSQADTLVHALFGFPPVHGGILRYAASGSSAVAAAAAGVLGRKLAAPGRAPAGNASG